MLATVLPFHRGERERERERERKRERERAREPWTVPASDRERVVFLSITAHSAGSF